MSQLSTLKFVLRSIVYDIKSAGKSDLFPLIWNLLYLITSQAKKFQLEWGQLKIYKVWNKKREREKEENKHQEEQGFPNSIERWRE